MAERKQQAACTCEAFANALRTAFLDHIGDAFYLASRGGISTGRNFQSVEYGPKIEYCPFCGKALEVEADRHR